MQMRATVTSTKARVRDLKQVREILDNYRISGVEVLLDEEESTLTMAFEDSDQAIHGGGGQVIRY